ncbi:TraB/GumN family protein [Piscinibacter sp.]|uniref:TraB/GumN family protein n=1 Tax=Piscinibacter sp. TaxID=1903157 RepID=UPI002C096015|nr:TraB/GumN family protein [Albitalea sp.]HUG24953.1 TraB/GumN family protein [Albitalea sp.]
MNLIRRFAAALLGAAALAVGLPTAAQTADACPPSAQMPTQEQAQAGRQAARDRGFLWRIRKDGRSSYLYGTVHVARFDWLWPGSAVLDAVRASDVIALELDMLDPDIVQRLRAGMAPRPDRALSAPLAARMKAQLKSACLPEQLMAAMSPEMIATTLIVMAGRRDGLDPAYAIDMVLADLGRELKKPVASLESPELQLQLLHASTAAQAEAMVEQVLSSLEAGEAGPMLERIAQIWADGRLQELERYEQWCDCLDTAEERALHERLLDGRNPALAGRIDALHRGGKRVFAAVGALHMIGPRGLPALLAQLGYEVERVTFK